MNGTTYAGRRARTTGAPQNHWFGPAGTPLAGGIGTIEAIRLVWSCHREVISRSRSRRGGMDHASARLNLESNRIGSSNALFYVLPP